MSGQATAGERYEGWGEEAYREAAAHPTGDKLIACAWAEPLPEQREILRRAVAQARAAGLNIPDTLRCGWRDRPRDAFICYGCMVGRDGGTSTIYLDANLWPEELQRVIYHELQHVHDQTSGAWSSFSPAERERRADQFAAEMMR